jgi:hypothetical protein
MVRGPLPKVRGAGAFSTCRFKGDRQAAALTGVLDTPFDALRLHGDAAHGTNLWRLARAVHGYTLGQGKSRSLT